MFCQLKGSTVNLWLIHATTKITGSGIYLLCLGVEKNKVQAVPTPETAIHLKHNTNSLQASFNTELAVVMPKLHFQQVTKAAMSHFYPTTASLLQHCTTFHYFFTKYQIFCNLLLILYTVASLTLLKDSLLHSFVDMGTGSLRCYS